MKETRNSKREKFKCKKWIEKQRIQIKEERKMVGIKNIKSKNKSGSRGEKRDKEKKVKIRERKKKTKARGIYRRIYRVIRRVGKNKKQKWEEKGSIGGISSKRRERQVVGKGKNKENKEN